MTLTLFCYYNDQGRRSFLLFLRSDVFYFSSWQLLGMTTIGVVELLMLYLEELWDYYSGWV